MSSVRFPGRRRPSITLQVSDVLVPGAIPELLHLVGSILIFNWLDNGDAAASQDPPNAHRHLQDPPGLRGRRARQIFATIRNNCSSRPTAAGRIVPTGQPQAVENRKNGFLASDRPNGIK
jgi:hypothetical protein